MVWGRGKDVAEGTMLFNTPEFAVFFVVVLGLYYVLPHRGQNVMLLAASYLFYGWWDWRFLGLLLFSTVIDYGVGLGLVGLRDERFRKWLLVSSIVIQMSLLAFFKYYNFFAENVAAAGRGLGFEFPPWTLNVLLPVGISFYTFHTMSYTIDIYRRQLEPTRDFIAFALFISYFPQLVAGPIARAHHLLPQTLHPRRPTLEKCYEGSYFILWGLFKKVVIADNLSVVVDRAFHDPAGLDSLAALVAVYAFAWQIYCDFSGYTDIARGCAICMDFHLQLNFNLPYFSVDPGEFWRRWHISLSSWLRDYLFIPLGGSREGTVLTYRNLMLTMLLGGLWHGASWTFVAWGAYHGLLLATYRALCPDLDRRLRSPWSRALNVLVFFHLVCIGWIFFRADSLADCAGIARAFTRAPRFPVPGLERLMLVAPLLVAEFAQYRKRDQRVILTLPWPVRSLIYVGLYVALIGLGRWSRDAFIYFQF